MAIIRKAKESDIPDILELYRQLTIYVAPAEFGLNPTIDQYRQVFAQINSFKGMDLLVAEDNAEVVGSIVLLIVPNLSHKGLPWALVENVIVHEKLRRSGIGKLMMEYAIKKASEAGCCRIGLSSNNSRIDAHKFYASLGFKPSSTGFWMVF